MKPPRFFKTAPALLALLALAGCVTPPALPPAATPRDATAIAAGQSLPATPGAVWPGDGWWQAYGDPQLDALVAEALAGSPDIAAAAARLRRAEGMEQAAGGALLPTLDAQGSAGWDKASYNNGFPKAFVPKGWNDRGQLAGALSFDLDIWGRNRAALAAATSDRRAAEVDLAQSRLMIAGAMVSAYADLARLFDERAVRAAWLALREKAEDLVRRRVASGLDNRASLDTAEAQTATARGDLAAAEQALALRRNQIAALAGAGPDRGLAITPPQWRALPDRPLPDGVTTDLLGRRPDLVSARERVEAMARRVKVARTAFYPAISLSALYGMQSLGLDALLQQDSTAGSIGAAISLPLFRGGQLQGQYRNARGALDEAVAGYDKAVLAAYQDLADAVTARRLNAERLAEARKALAASEAAHALARRRYEAGLSSWLDVVAVEDRALQARLAATALEGALRQSDAALNRALGGGYAAPAERLARTTRDD